MSKMKEKKSRKFRYLLITLFLLALISFVYFKINHKSEIKLGNFNIEVPKSEEMTDTDAAYSKMEIPQLVTENKLRREINGTKYIFETVASSENKYRMRFGLYDKESKQIKEEFKDAKRVLVYYMDDNVLDFWFDEARGIFITMSTPGGWPSGNKTDITINKYFFDTKTYKLLNKETIYAEKFTDGYNLNANIEGYFADKDILIIQRSNEISCFGKGAVYKIASSKKELISEYTNGCLYEHPRFGGISNGKIIFADQIKNSYSSGTTSTGRITNMYAFDPVTLQKQPIAGFSARQNLDLLEVNLYRDEKTREQNVMLYGAESFYLYNIVDKKLIKIEDFEATVDTY